MRIAFAITLLTLVAASAGCAPAATMFDGGVCAASVVTGAACGGVDTCQATSVCPSGGSVTGLCTCVHDSVGPCDPVVYCPLPPTTSHWNCDFAPCCAAATTCDQCAAMNGETPRCGWSFARGACVDAEPSGTRSVDGASSGNDWAWLAPMCGCGPNVTCGGCAQTGRGCGWCGSTQTCMIGLDTASQDGTCTGSDWVPASQASACTSLPGLCRGTPCVVEVSAGGAHTCARLDRGAVACWGLNTEGELGNDSRMNSLVPVLVRTLQDAVQVSAGASHVCARRAGGTVVCWGRNRDGALGNGTTIDALVPVPVAGLTDAVEISAGDSYTCARRANGGVVCWGTNDHGQLGNGTTTPESTPVPVVGLTDAVEISARGSVSACARRASGAVVCWGSTAHGVLGDGSVSPPLGSPIPDRLTPVAVVGLADAVEIATGGSHACARRATGTIVCWGDNEAAQLGDGTAIDRSTPTTVTSLSGAVEISAGWTGTCARDAGGAVSCWGNEIAASPPGDGSNPSPTPLAVTGLTNARSITTSHQTCALRTDQTVVCWGNNQNGELGNGTTTNALSPVQVIGL